MDKKDILREGRNQIIPPSDDMILCIKDSKDFPRKLSDVINALNRTKGYEINLQKNKQLFFYIPVRNMVIKSEKKQSY